MARHTCFCGALRSAMISSEADGDRAADVHNNSCSHDENLNCFGRFGNRPNESDHEVRTGSCDRGNKVGNFRPIRVNPAFFTRAGRAMELRVDRLPEIKDAADAPWRAQDGQQGTNVWRKVTSPARGQSDKVSHDEHRFKLQSPGIAPTVPGSLVQCARAAIIRPDASLFFYRGHRIQRVERVGRPNKEQAPGLAQGR